MARSAKLWTRTAAAGVVLASLLSGAGGADARLAVRPSHQALARRAEGFDGFVRDLWPDAERAGVSRATYEAAFAGVAPDPEVLAKTHHQAEFAKPLGDYLATAVSDKRIGTGKGMVADWGDTLARVEARYGVDRYVVLGVWGMETNFGHFAGDESVVRSLATLAAAHYRGDYFRRELIAALRILEHRDIDPAHMLGSWAGAMGQTQFMPSSFRSYAVDFDGDGKRDIWGSVPDAVGSTANFLRRHGWVANETWGYEVTLPGALRRGGTAGRWADFPTWAERGVRRADGGDMPGSGRGQLLLPAGTGGPAFLVTPNFKVIKSYNNSTAYALGVALLGDRIAGWGPLKGQWPMASR